MSPEFFIVTIFVIVVGILVVESIRAYRSNPRLSPTRDKKKPVELPEPDDGRPKRADLHDIAADASCGGDAGGD